METESVYQKGGRQKTTKYFKFPSVSLLFHKSFITGKS